MTELEAKEKRIEELTEWLKEASDGKLKLQMLRADLVSKIGNQKKRIAELEAQNEKLIDFVISKTECCDVCPITDTCINSEGTCPYCSEILAKGEEEVTREWLIQFISRR